MDKHFSCKVQFKRTVRVVARSVTLHDEEMSSIDRAADSVDRDVGCVRALCRTVVRPPLILGL
jgi:hypothetical protein